MNNGASSLTDKNPKFYYGYVIVIVGFSLLMVTSGTLYTFGVFVKPLIDEFQWSREVTAGAYSITIFVLGIFFMITGRLNDRFGPRRVLTVCGFILGGGYALVSRVNEVWQLYLICGLVIAMGQSGIMIPMLSTVARWFVKKRGLMSGIVIAGVGVGQVIMPLAATKLISIYGWRTTFIIIGIVCFVAMVVLARLVKRNPAQVGQYPDGDSKMKGESIIFEARVFTRGEAIRTRQFWMIFAAYICYAFMVQGTMVHITPHAIDMGISPVAAASVLSFIGGASIAGRVGMGSAGDRIGIRCSMVYLFILGLGSFIWIQFARELWMLYLFAILFGFAYGGLISLESPLVASMFGMKAHGAILGLTHFGATIGGALSPLLAGRIFDTTGSYRTAFLVVTGFIVAGLVLVSLLKPPAASMKGTLERSSLER